MDTRNKNTQLDFRTRLIAFLLVLAVGFVMGWVNGRNDTPQTTASTGIVAQQTQGDAQAQDAQAERKDEDADTQATTSESTPQDGSETSSDAGTTTVAPTRGPTVEKDGWYTSKDEVALYIHTYGRLPGNFISKTKARNRGWDASIGNLDDVCPGMSIGGSRYYNDDGQLPDKKGRQWTECDINYSGGYRGAERIVFSNDGLIFYTADHYETFEQLY